MKKPVLRLLRKVNEIQDATKFKHFFINAILIIFLVGKSASLSFSNIPRAQSFQVNFLVRNLQCKGMMMNAKNMSFLKNIFFPT